MSDFQFRTLENIKKDELIKVFNSSFADYFVKIKLNPQTLSDKILAENIDLENSVGAFFEDKLVGFILQGIECKNSYNAGTGVLHEFRGNQLTSKMYEFILPKLNSLGIKNQQLEVITQNISAINIYQKTGFEIVRNLVCLGGKVKAEKVNNEVELKPLQKIDEPLLSAFWDSQPSWQNSLSAIQRTINQHKILAAFFQNELVGYLIYSKNGRIKQFTVKKEFRYQGIGQTLFAQLNNLEFIITNIDKNDFETISFLQKIGLSIFLEQFEMKLNF